MCESRYQNKCSPLPLWVNHWVQNQVVAPEVLGEFEASPSSGACRTLADTIMRTPAFRARDRGITKLGQKTLRCPHPALKTHK